MRLFFTVFFLNGIFIITFGLMLIVVIEQAVAYMLVSLLFAFLSIPAIINSVNATIF